MSALLHAILAPMFAASRLEEAIAEVLALSEVRASGHQPTRRALADAEEERARRLAVLATAGEWRRRPSDTMVLGIVTSVVVLQRSDAGVSS